MFQLDGNMSFSSSCIETEDREPSDKESAIEVIVGHRPAGKPKLSRTPFRKTVRRDNMGALSLHLPNIAVYNHRSIWKKFKNFCLEFKEMSMGIAFHSEVWEKR